MCSGGEPELGGWIGVADVEPEPNHLAGMEVTAVVYSEVGQAVTVDEG